MIRENRNRRLLALLGAGAFAASGAFLVGCEEGYESETRIETPQGEIETQREIDRDLNRDMNNDPTMRPPTADPGMDETLPPADEPIGNDPAQQPR